MYSKFIALNKDKQNEILNSALKEFAQKGFESASTNKIVKDAGISKGSLFNYFNSKKGLYLYLFDYSIKIIEELFIETDVKERDLFKRIGNIGIEKLKIYKNNPYLLDFLASVELEDSPEIKSLTKDRIALVYKEGIDWIYKDIDYSKFKEDIDINKIVEIQNWTIFGFGEKVIKEMDYNKDNKEFGEITLIEWEKYSNILKSAFYK